MKLILLHERRITMIWCVCRKTDDLQEAQKWAIEVSNTTLKEIGKFGNPIFNTNV